MSTSDRKERLDIDAIERRQFAALPDDMIALIAEVRRLREENFDLSMDVITLTGEQYQGEWVTAAKAVAALHERRNYMGMGIDPDDVPALDRLVAAFKIGSDKQPDDALGLAMLGRLMQAGVDLVAEIRGLRDKARELSLRNQPEKETPCQSI